MPPLPSQADRELIAEKLAKLAEIESDHDDFCRKVEDNYKSYRGFMESRSDAARWRSKLHPPYVQNIIETFVANVVDDKIYFRVVPRPRITDPDELEFCRLAAKSQEYLLNYQLDLDRFSEKQRQFVLQASIARISILKSWWKYEKSNLPYFQGGKSYTPSSRQDMVVKDDPTAEVVDVRDFIYPLNTTSPDKLQYCFHRVWLTFEDLKRLEANGVYKNIDQLKESKDWSVKHEGREQALWNIQRTKGKIEVLEYWSPDRTCTLANRKVLIDGPKDNPFEFSHLPHRFPFQFVTTMPDLFRLIGMSEVDSVRHIQEMIWSLMNQRMDTTELCSNAIIMMRADLENPDSYEFAPGEKWLVDDPSQIKWFEINPQATKVFLEAEQLLKGDLQNVTGGTPMLSGAETSSLSNRTATGVSIFTSLAQKLMAVKKQQFLWAYERMGDQWLAMNSQFMEGPRLVPIIGKDGAQIWEKAFPSPDASLLKVDIEPSGESLIRQERKAEAMALMQTAAQIAPVMMAVGIPFNLKAFAEDWLEANGKTNTERYFSAQQQAMPPGQPGAGQGGPPQQPGGYAQPGTGMTSPQAVSPLAPSNPTSMSGQQFLQQLNAMSGGVANK